MHKIIQKPLFCFFIILYTSNCIYAQPIKDVISYDTLTYVYKLNKVQLDYIFQKNTIEDTSLLWTSLYNTYSNKVFKEDTLDFGSYITASINDKTIYYNYVYKVPFVLSCKVLDEKVIVYVHNKKTKLLIKNIQMELMNTKIIYDEGYGGFVFDKKTIDNIPKNIHYSPYITLEYENKNYAVPYSVSMYDKQNDRTPQYNYNLSSYGYFIKDKPKYKHLDTLHLKAFLVDYKKGKPIARKSKITLNEPMSNFYYSTKLKNTSKGAYVFNWAIPDSLKLDRAYNATITYKKRGKTWHKKTSFTLEDYVLNKNTLEAHINNPIFFAGEDISFYASAKDANGFPLMGVNIQYKLKITRINQLYTDTLILSDAKKNNWYENDTLLGSDNYNKVTIPSAILPKANATYTLEVTITDPETFEQKVSELSFTKLIQKEKLLFHQISDSLYIHNLYNLKDTYRVYTLVTLSGNDTITHKKITTPYHYKLSHLENKAILLDSISVVGNIDILYYRLEILKLNGKRTADSIHIAFKYPFATPVHYKLYKEDKEIKSGEATQLQFTLPDNSKSKYSIQFTNNLFNSINENFYKITYVPQDKIIQVNSDLPEHAFPGEEIPIRITTTDYKNKPLSNINIAAYALNKMFEDAIEIPQIDIPEQYKNQIDIQPVKSTGTCTFSMPKISNKYTIRKKHIAQYHLLKNEYYKCKFPEQGYTVLKTKKQNETPEFSVAITHNYNTYMPKYILLDGNVVFITDLFKNQEYSFASNNLSHTLAFRYFSHLYTIKNVNFENYTKHVLCVNMDSILEKNTVLSVSDSLPVFEPSYTEKNMLYNTMLLTNVFNFDSLQLRSIQGMDRTQKIYFREDVAKINVDGNNYFSFGPFPPNSIIKMYINGKKFELKNGVQFAHYYDEITKQVTTKKLDTIQGAIFGFSEKALSNQQLTEVLIPDTIAEVPTISNSQINRNTIQANKELEEMEFYQSYGNTTINNTIYLQIENSNPKKYIRSVWIINNKVPTESKYISSISQSNNALLLYQKSNDGVFDYYFLFNNNQMCYMPNVRVHSNDYFYINSSYLKTDTLTNDKLAIPLHLYAELTKVPLLPFYFPPNETLVNTHEKRNEKRKNCYLSGQITDNNLSPIPNAIVYAEINGVFKYGATTNNNGLFEIVNMLPATYQLKIYSPEYQIVHCKPSLLSQGNEYSINIALQNAEINKPIFESIQSDFRFLSFIKNTQKNKLKLMLYNQDTREPISNVEVRMLEKGKVLKTIQLQNEYETEIPFIGSETNDISFEIRKQGYVPLRINHIQFIENYYYELHTFLTEANAKNIFKSKEFDINMSEIPILEQNDDDNNQVSYEDQWNKAQKDNFGGIRGIVLDENNKPMEDVNVKLYRGGKFIAGNKTNKYGEYYIKKIEQGDYDIQFIYIEYKKVELLDITIVSNKNAVLTVMLNKEKRKELKAVIRSARNTDESDNFSPYRGNNYSATTSVSDLAATTAGVYQKKASPSSISIGGARNDNTIIMIDGVPVRGNANFKLAMNSVDEVEIYKKSKNQPLWWMNPLDYAYDSVKNERKKVSSDMLDEFVNNKNNSSTLRKNFSDLGYWKPNLITNKKGEVTTTIKLPDNITTWKNIIVSMGSNWLHGITTSETKVYKPLQTFSIVPNFMYENDKVWARAKYVNLTDSALKTTCTISVNNAIAHTQQVNIEKQFVDSTLLHPTNTDSVLWNAGLVYNTNYKDAEQFTIPVFSSAMKFYTNQSIGMDKDSTYTLKFANNTKGHIILNNQLYEKIIHEVDQLNNYEYGCVEQNASKLKALLYKNKIQKQLGIKDNAINKQINTILQKLADYQNADGSFGWWRKHYTNWRMTIYAMSVLYQANESGFGNNYYIYAKNNIMENISSFSNSDKLFALYYVQTIESLKEQYIKDVKSMDVLYLNTTDKLYYYAILQGSNNPVPVSDLYALYLEMNNSINRPYYDNFFYDSKNDVYNAYTIFYGTPLAVQWLKLFKKKLLNGQLENNLTTFARASMIEALTNIATDTTQKKIQATVVLNDTLIITTFPYKIPIQSNNYTIKHTGGNVFVNTSEENYTYTPTVHDSMFKITTQFEQKNVAVQQVKAGVKSVLQATVFAYQKAEYVMVEIPIPSGMQVINKQKNTSSNYYIEYFKHKVVVFYSNMEIGNYSIRIELQPNLKGQYTMPASKASLMYYPYIYGNTINKEITIE